MSAFLLSELNLAASAARHRLCKLNQRRGRFWLLRKAEYNVMTKGGLQLRHLCLLWTYRTVTSFVLLMSRWIPWACPDQTQAHKSICMLRTSDLCFLKRNSNTYTAVPNRLWLCLWAIFRIFLTLVDLDWIRVSDLHVCAAFHRSSNELCPSQGS